MSEALRLTEQLIAQASVTPADAQCQQIIAQRLGTIGFYCEPMAFGPDDWRVSNLWAKRAGAGRPQDPAGPLLVFAGHTDVVPTGPLAQWKSPPFVPTHRDGRLYGRGASDMKASLAAFVVACEEFLAARPDTVLALGFVLTSDEEGPARDGTRKVCEALQQRGEQIDYCIVGEPTAVKATGDMIKNGRRGSLSGKLTVQGLQGHVAYPHLARNAVHLLAPALAELATLVWDDGNAFFPPTTWQVSNLHAGTGAGNVVPGEAVADFNFRFSTASTPEQLQQRLQQVLDRHGLQYRLDWTLGAEPFITASGTLVQAICSAVQAETGGVPELSTTGGTSDARFMAKICPQVVELGPPNASIHQIDENIVLADLESLKNIYRRILETLDAGLPV
ncbi:MAG: succinyl-diaminopimelate desuccinylase [Rhodoferax sp.]|nr:succinyl-diaminopimelate desuccinylase [Rhodoferax sp.]MBP9930495.1 succinyl-diaminopimelate desuccinylase [Rhodoferax sp.]HQZ06590.1 succinyl-diaminopimelate desuccinylase [Burkholderiaceae bacterium]